MKEKELRAYADCSACGKKIGHTGLPIFWRVTVEQFGIDMKAVQRQQGFAMMMGGNAAIAMAMGRDEEMTQVLAEKRTLSICAQCATEQRMLIEFVEMPSVDPSL